MFFYRTHEILQPPENEDLPEKGSYQEVKVIVFQASFTRGFVVCLQGGSLCSQVAPDKESVFFS